MGKFQLSKKSAVQIIVPGNEATAAAKGVLLESIAGQLNLDELVLLEKACKNPTIKNAAIAQLQKFV